MTINSPAFVPTEEIQKITRGSYEHLISRLSEAAEATLVGVFGETTFEFAGTFAGHALVVGEDGSCVRLRYEDSKGSIKILGTDKYALKTVTESSYIKSAAKKAVDAFIAGAMSESAECLRELIRRVPAKRAVTDDRIAEEVSKAMRAPRPWKRQFAENTAKFRTFLGESTVAALDSGRMASKFSALYESTELQTADQDSYFAVVQEAFQTISGKLEALQHELEESIVSLNTTAPKIAELGESEVLTALNTFAQDLLSDIRSVYKVVQESFHQVGRIDCLGKIYDSIAEEFNQYEVATRFVVEMTKSLAQASE